MSKQNLISPATKPGYVVVEAVYSEDGGMCLVVNDTRVAGCKPIWCDSNVRYRWNVREEYLCSALGCVCKKDE